MCEYVTSGLMSHKLQEGKKVKKDGKYHFCINFRKLNQVTKKNVYFLDGLQDYFTKIHQLVHLRLQFLVWLIVWTVLSRLLLLISLQE